MAGPVPAPGLPEQLLARRTAKRLSFRRAGRLAGAGYRTWIGWEQGVRPQSRHWRGIEEALDWAPGSVAAILAGGEPTPLEQDYTDPVTGKTYVEPDDRALWDDRHELALRFVESHGEERAAELGAQRARELIAYLRTRTAMEPPPPPANPSPARVA